MRSSRHHKPHRDRNVRQSFYRTTNPWREKIGTNSRQKRIYASNRKTQEYTYHSTAIPTPDITSVGMLFCINSLMPSPVTTTPSKSVPQKRTRFHLLFLLTLLLTNTVTASIDTVEESTCTFLPDETVGIPSLVNNHLVIDKQSGHTEKSCARVATLFEQTVKKFPQHEQDNRRVLERPAGDPKIICTTSEQLQKQHNHRQSSAFFAPQLKGIYLPTPLTAEGSSEKDTDLIITINHELRHARMFYAHSEAPCKEEDIEKALSPIYPFTQSTAQKYHKALAKGDRRVEEFFELYKKEKSKESLSNVEKKKLNKYRKTSRSCHIGTITNPMPPHLYSAMKKHNQSTIRLKNAIDMRLVSVAENNDGSLTATLQPLDPDSIVLLLHEKLTAEMETYHKNLSPALTLAERDANTFEGFSEEASIVFYPEAHKLYRHFKKKCTPEAELEAEKQLRCS